MEERTQENTVKTNSAVSWLALALSLAALAVGVTAYNRSGEDLGTTIREETQEAGQEIQEEAEQVDESAELAAARVAARTRLAALQARIAAGESAEELANEVNDVQTDLQEAYNRAGVEFAEEWTQLNTDLENLETQVRNGSADALGVLEGLLGSLEQEVRTDDNPE